MYYKHLFRALFTTSYFTKNTKNYFEEINANTKKVKTQNRSKFASIQKRKNKFETIILKLSFMSLFIQRYFQYILKTITVGLPRRRQPLLKTT